MSKNKSKTVKANSKPKLRKITKADIKKAKKDFGEIEAKFNIAVSEDSLSVDVRGTGKSLMFLFSRVFSESEQTYEMVKAAISLYEEFKKSPIYDGFKEGCKK